MGWDHTLRKLSIQHHIHILCINSSSCQGLHFMFTMSLWHCDGKDQVLDTKELRVYGPQTMNWVPACHLLLQDLSGTQNLFQRMKTPAPGFQNTDIGFAWSFVLFGEHTLYCPEARRELGWGLFFISWNGTFYSTSSAFRKGRSHFLQV